MNEQLADSEVLTRAANAFVTYRRCLGHKKAARCEESFLHWKAIAMARGIAFPSEEQLSSVGRFNGPGAA
jgi:hypothetical protein